MVKTTRKPEVFNSKIRGDEMAYLKVNQACKFLGISRGTIYKYVALGLLEVRREESGTDKIGKTIELKFHTDDLEKFKESLKKKVKRGQRLVV